MLHFTSGNMFELPVDIRVNTVNCVGVMGAGVALAFKTRHPAMFRAYKKACDAGEIRPGALHIWRTLTEWVINFPTKRHWRENSKYEDIEDGLKALRTYLDSLGRTVRVALPALGCGHGGLDWPRVSKRIECHLATTGAEVFVFEPADSRHAGEIVSQLKKSEIEPRSDMVAYPTTQIRMESIVSIGPSHTRPALMPPSSFPMQPVAPVARVGQRVRRTATHPKFPIGMLGTIDVVHEDGCNFWVLTDEGGFCGWTTYEQWTPVGTEDHWT